MHQVLSPLFKHPHLSPLRSLSLAAGSLYLCLAASVVLGQGSSQPSETAPPARQNQILRDYFRKQYLEISQTGIEQANERFLDEYVDRQIDHYLKQIREKMESMKNHLSAIERARLEFLEGSSGNLQKSVKTRWKEAVADLGREAADLRTLLAFVLVDLKGNTDFKPEIKPDAVRTGFENEIEFLSQEVQKADEGIRNYLFLPSNTVNLEELKGENMLAFLYRVREMAEKLYKQL